tara:strand:- start:1422 stop:2453 length:1032 start_codon:yes stop_codon:yes gene_type:complete
MKNKYLELFENLSNRLDFYHNETKNQRYLQIMLERRLKSLPKNEGDVYEPDKITRKIIYAIDKNVSLDDIDSKEAQKQINISKIQKYLSDFVRTQMDSEILNRVGYIPVIQVESSRGGRGNEKTFWLDIEPVELLLPSVALEDEDSPEDYSEIIYVREHNSTIKPSILTRIFFKNGELKMYSLKGLLLTALMLISLLIDILIILFAVLFIIFIKDLPSLSLITALIILAFIPFAYMNFIWFFKPLHHLTTHRISKAPLLFANINTDNADIEMYKGADGYRIARITAFTSICPICTASIELADGKPDQKQPLVGRCREAPHAHVYSFDRMTLKGYFLGHEGYLK